MAKAKKKIQPMFWITGNYYDCRNQWERITSLVKDANVEVLNCGHNTDNTPADLREATAADVITLLRTRDIFDENPRIIKMKGLPSDYKVLSDYLEYVSDSNVLVIDAPIGYYDGRGSFKTAASSKLYKTISTKGKVFKFDTEAKNESEAITWSQKVCSDLGKKIERDSLQYLVQAKGLNLDILYSDLLKLTYYQSSKVITMEDVKNCCIPLHTSSVFDLVDALNSMNYEKSIEMTYEFCEHAGEARGDSFIGDVEKLFGLLHMNFLFMTLMADAPGHLSYDSAIAAIDGITKVKADGTAANVFSKGYVGMNIRKPAVKKLLGAGKQHIYMMLLFLNYCKTYIRMNSSNKTVTKNCILTLCMLSCRKIVMKDALCLLGFTGEEINRKS